jgi:RNA polymerase sigma-70 factor (ECF subfamily)
MVRARDAAAPVLRLVPRDPDTLARPTLDDVELRAAMRRGDASAATALHDRVRQPIERALVRVLGARDCDHEELTQTTLIEFVRSIDRFRGECSLDTWVSRIAAHVAYKAIRRRKIERRVLETRADFDDALGPDDLDRNSIDRCAIARIRQHLASMDEAKAWTVVLHDVCGYDLREIAEITDVSVSAAQTRLSRGRRELHERLQADPELADELHRRSR